MTALTLSVARDLDELRRLRPGRGSIGFVPTMGALHDGHLSLVRRALAENEHCIVSIFVNPTQFDDPTDLANYPTTFEDDCALLSSVGAPIVLAPTADLLYADGYRTRVSEHVDALVLEGEHRPGHFDGMLTVVLKLLNIARADRAYFGEKDFQQLLLVRTMVKSLFHPTRILGCPTIREDDGLAMSSRNRRLNPAQRELAGRWASLLADFDLTAEEVARRLEALGFRVDYVAEQWGRRLGAVHTPPVDGGPEVRLIDNLALPGVGDVQPVNVLFQVSGSIACYKAAHVVSRLSQAGHDVRVAASRSALAFVGAATFEGLSGNAVVSETFEAGRWMEHIELPRWADLTLLCPATANRLNKMAAGVADDLLGNLFLTHDFAKPFLIAPAMNTRMWQHPTTQASIDRLVGMGLELVAPDAGALACREVGDGRLADPDGIVALVMARLAALRS